VIEGIKSMNAAGLVFILKTLVAGFTATDFLSGKLEKLGFNSFLSNSFRTYLMSVAVLPSFLALPLKATTFIACFFSFSLSFALAFGMFS
jgi:hypothetical protein